MCAPMLKPKCRINILKVRGALITTLEAKVLQFILMKNRQIHTMDFSECIDDNNSNFCIFLAKLDNFSNVRSLSLDGMLHNMNSCIEPLGDALSTNEKLHILNLRNTRIRVNNYSAFWTSL